MARRQDTPIHPATRVTRHARVLAGLVLVAIALACAPTSDEPDTGGAASTPPRRVVLIVIDTLRADHVGTYGYEKDTAPFLDGLATAGTVFERAHSTSSWTAPSTASIMTGRYPTRHGVIEGFFAHQHRESLGATGGDAVQPLAKLPADAPLLAERLRDAGFRTFGAASNINIGSVLGFDRGFERFVEAKNAPAEQLVAEVSGWGALRADATDRSFLYLHLNDVHIPYEPRMPWYTPPAPGQRPGIPAYDSEISYVDHQLSRLSESLGWDERTLVVVVSDHGEEFGDHGGVRHDGGLHEELTHVVMIVSGAGVASGRVDVDVSLVDVLPTILELAGVHVDAAGDLDGRSLTPLLGAANATARDEFASRPLLAHRAKMGREYGQHWWAVIQDGWKLIVDESEPALYDHRSDRHETVDRADSEAERLRQLTAQLDALRAGGIRSDGERTEITLDDEMVDALETLGYVDRPDGAATKDDAASEEGAHDE